MASSTTPPGTPGRPGASEIRAAMGIPSEGLDRRGQKDAVGFATTADQMARTWEASALPPLHQWPPPTGGLAGAICPHDDYIYAGRVYRAVIPLVTARTVVLVGVFHGYRRFGARDALVFDPYRRWRAPDGDVEISTLRDAWLERLQPGDAIQDATMHDSEHSVEAIVYWLRHRRPDLEIVPVLVSAMSFDRLSGLAERAGAALGTLCAERGLALGRDVAIVISADAVHYGADFAHTPFGPGGEVAHRRAAARDTALLEEAIAGPVEPEKARALYEMFVNPANPDEYRLTWCGRFSIPFGMLLLRAAAATGGGVVIAHPLAYSTSVSAPSLPLSDAGLGVTAPATFEHFVGHAAVGFTIEVG